MNMPTNIEAGKTAGPGQPFERLVPNPKARLREQFHEVCRFKRMAERTEEAEGRRRKEEGGVLGLSATALDWRCWI